MRILILSRCPPWPLFLGDRLIVYHLARALAGRGHTLDLLAFYDRPTDPGETAHYRDYFRSVQLIREPARRVGSYVARLMGGRPFYPKNARAAWSPAMWQAAAEKLAGEASGGYDVVQLFGGVQVYEYRALVEKWPNLIVPYESYTLFLTRLFANQRGRLAVFLQREMARAFERRMFAGFGAVVVLTEADAAALQALDPSLPLAVIPNGIDLDEFRLTGAPPDPHLLVFTGNFEYGPNVDAARWLARAIFPHIRAKNPRARLQLVGNAPPPDLRALDDGPQGTIHVTGRVPDVRPYLESAALFICPLRTGAGIKNKVLEAMAMARPLVATPLSLDGIPALDGQHALTGESAEELATAALRLLAEPDLQRRMGAANRRLIEARFTWAAVATHYEALYARLR